MGKCFATIVLQWIWSWHCYWLSRFTYGTPPSYWTHILARN